MASWADLPLDPLDLVVAGLANPADRARSRAVCRSWHSAVRRHGPQTAQLPWIVFFYDLSGSANEWLLFGIYYRTPKLIDNYVLHNIFSGERVSLTELDATLHRAYRISKFQMRSTAHDFMAVVTTNENHPLIVILSGKGVWLPEPRAVPYVYIVNIAFCGDKLYGISKAEDLIPFDLGLDEDGRPMVTIGRHVIRRPLDYYGWDDDYNDDDEDDEDDEDDDVGGEDEEEVDIDVAADDEDEDEEKMKEAEAVLDVTAAADNVVVNDFHEEEGPNDDDDDGRSDFNYRNISHDGLMHEKEYTRWHLVQSRGELFMVGIPMVGIHVRFERFPALYASCDTSGHLSASVD
uniref:KIB1-4 beta-propeller domain-containing protein n=1 Tax=Aegilops tauschii TaxID=37682 RepID=M8BJE1_AEGTA